MLREVGCRLPAQSALARTATAAPGAQVPRARAAQSARMRAQQPTCKLGHITCVQAQSTRLRTRQPHRSRQSAACHQHNPHICAHSNLRANSATSSALKHNPRVCARGNVGLRRFRHHGCSTIRALAHTATAPVPPICCLASAKSARMRAQQRGQLVDSASGDAVRPAHLNARQQPTMLPQALSQRAFGGTRHSSPATPTRLVHEDALCFLARLEKRIFSLGAGDKHGRDSQAD